MPLAPNEQSNQNIKRMLRPIVRHCIRGSSKIQNLIKLLKEVYVEVAVEELVNSGEKVTLSRISVMTGVQRVDAKKIYRDDESLGPVIGDVASRVIGQWSADKHFLTKDGKPKVLTYEGRDSEFEVLVAKISKNLGPAAVLFELERVGAVQKTRGGLRLEVVSQKLGRHRAYVSRLLGKSVEALMTASYENGLSNQADVPHLHIQTEYDNVFVEDLPKIQEWIKREGRRFHKRARDYISKFDQDINRKVGKPAGARVLLGAFGYCTPGSAAGEKEVDDLSESDRI
ncbi:MAG: hypothetical protein KDD66_10110 [Bdellovibrionales bacterium]|nr:hypothetical protein [Bdellovibrionales bacterium]